MKDEKSLWIKALEKDSWHAELVASGMAIYGSISLGPVLDDWAQYLMVYFDERTLNIVYFALLYVFMAQSVLVFSFIFHLSLRIVWVAFLGLSSVFPHGIGKEHKTYSDNFLAHLKEEFPDISAYTIKIDKVCSVVFSILCVVVMISFSYFFWIVVFTFIAYLLSFFLDDNMITWIGIIVGSTIITLLMLLSLTSMKRFENNIIVKKVGYKPSKFLGSVFFPIVGKPMGYIMNTLATNTSSNAFGFAAILFPIFGIISTASHIEKIAKYYSSAENYYKVNYREGKADSGNYLDSSPQKYIRNVVIQSDKIEEDYIMLFIPYFEREQPHFEKVCGIFEKNDTLSKRENRIFENQYYNTCANQYYTVFIDDRQMSITLNSKYHEHNDEWGFEAFIDIAHLSKGRHVLRLDTKFEFEQQYASRYIPFLKVK